MQNIPGNHAGFVLQWGGMVIYNDPVGNAALSSNLPDPDLILVGHRHSDHFSGATISDLAEAHR